MARRFAKSAGVTQEALRPILTVELTLFALTQLAPGEPAKDAWALASGYDFRRAGHTVGPLPPSLRWLLEPVKSEHNWKRALGNYRTFAQQARMFDVPDSDLPPVPRPLVGGAEREQCYRDLLDALPAHLPEHPPVAEVGFRHRVRRTGNSVVIPEGVALTKNS